MLCKSYRGISLLSVPGKVLCSVITQRINRHLEEGYRETQHGFRKGKSTVDAIFVLRQTIEKCYEWNIDCYNLFVDFQQAFDSVYRKGLWLLLRSTGIPCKLINILESLYDGTECAVKIGSNVSEWFNIESGVRQGCVLSPTLFNIVIDSIMAKVDRNCDSGIKLPGVTLKDMEFADDVDLLNNSIRKLQSMLDDLVNVAAPFGLKINAEKTKVMKVQNRLRQLRNEEEDGNVTLDGQALEEVREFKYLGSCLTAAGST